MRTVKLFHNCKSVPTVELQFTIIMTVRTMRLFHKCKTMWNLKLPYQMARTAMLFNNHRASNDNNFFTIVNTERATLLNKGIITGLPTEDIIIL